MDKRIIGPSRPDKPETKYEPKTPCPYDRILCSPGDRCIYCERDALRLLVWEIAEWFNHMRPELGSEDGFSVYANDFFEKPAVKAILNDQQTFIGSESIGVTDEDFEVYYPDEEEGK